MKRLSILMIALLFSSAATIFGQDNKEVAVLQPRIIGGWTVSTNDQLIISSSMKRAFTQIDGYEAYTRTSQALIAAEQAFQRSGSVDDAQIKIDSYGASPGADYPSATLQASILPITTLPPPTAM